MVSDNHEGVQKWKICIIINETAIEESSLKRWLEEEHGSFSFIAYSARNESEAKRRQAADLSGTCCSFCCRRTSEKKATSPLVCM